MPDVRPFRGIVYDGRKVRLEDVVAPPYDVISPELQSDFYNRSPYNVIRLILGRGPDQYVSAAGHFSKWRQEEVICQDTLPCIYALTQMFEFEGRHLERKGFVAACRLEAFGNGTIFPHELTHAKPKEDRFKLFEATGAMFSQIFGLYADPKNVLDKVFERQVPPDFEVRFDGITNRVWRLHDQLAIAALTDYLGDRKVIVADGHHRYETALWYRDSRRLKNPSHTGREAYNFVPMFFTNMNDPHLLVLPTHRILRDVADFSPQRFLEALESRFYVVQLSSADEVIARLRKGAGHSFGLILQSDPGFFFLSTRNIACPGSKLEDTDVAVLQSLVFKGMLRLTDNSIDRRLNLEYEKDAASAVRAVRENSAQAAFLLNPTPIEQIRAAAEAGVTLPQKSTFFFPKLLSGLIMYSFLD